MLEFYWTLGRDINLKRAESRWGSGFFNQLSLDLRNEFPDSIGFSTTNLKYMKRWYAFYYERVEYRHQLVDEIGHQLGDQLQEYVNREDEHSIRHQAGDELQTNDYPLQEYNPLVMPLVFGQVPWKHHIYIITKCKTLNEALFYIGKVSSEGWSRSQLEKQIATRLYDRQGTAISNFEHTLPQSQIQQAKEILKDPYCHPNILSQNVNFTFQYGKNVYICKSKQKFTQKNNPEKQALKTNQTESIKTRIHIWQKY